MQNNLSRRSKGREYALQIMYDADIADHGLTRGDLERSARGYWQNFATEGASHSFAESLIFGVCDRLDEVDGYLQEASTRWSIGRMAAVDRNVLRLGTYELLIGETPTPVVINEAVELAKKFGAEQSSAFVNGILDEIRRSIEEKSAG